MKKIILMGLFFYGCENTITDSPIDINYGVVINEIKGRVANLFEKCLKSGEYDYLAEKRTFKSSDVVEELEQLVVNDILVGESDRGVLAEITSNNLDIDNLVTHAKRMRKANEGRALNKNNIDRQFKELVKE